MEKNFLIVLLLLVSSICFAQKEAIELPKSYGFAVKYSKTSITPLYSIYINKKGDVDFENIRVPVTQLGDSLFKHSRNLRPDLLVWLITLIHADKNTPYIHVENVKSQMSSALLLKTVYRTGHIEDINSGLSVRLNRKSLIPERKLAAEENTGDIIFEDIDIVEDPIFKMIDDLYGLKFSSVKEILKSFSYKKVTFYSDKKLKINGKKFSLEDKESIYKEIKNTDFVFTFPNPKMTYGTYFKNIALLTKTYKDNKMSPAFIEVSSDLQKILKREKIRL